MRLYVDGQLVGTNTTTTAQSYTGYWRVGGDAGVTSTSAYLAGTIDEVAVYATALTAAQVRDALPGIGRPRTNAVAGGGVHAGVHEPRVLVRRQRICRCGRVDRRLCLGLRRRSRPARWPPRRTPTRRPARSR